MLPLSETPNTGSFIPELTKEKEKSNKSQLDAKTHLLTLDKFKNKCSVKNLQGIGSLKRKREVEHFLPPIEAEHFLPSINEEHATKKARLSTSSTPATKVLLKKEKNSEATPTFSKPLLKKRKREEESDRTVSLDVKTARLARFSSPHQEISKKRKEISFAQLKGSPMKTHSLPMKGEIYLKNIRDGNKKFEGRVNGPACQKLNPGEYIKFFDRSAKWGIICEIVTLDKYENFREMLMAKGVLNLLPQLHEQSKKISAEDLLKAGEHIYKKFPGSNRVTQYGAVAIGVKFIENTYHN